MTATLSSEEQLARRVLSEIAQELREHPERWCQDHIAKAADGTNVRFDDPHAVKWCVHGHIRKRIPLSRSSGGIILDRLWDAIGGSFYEWHDDPDRTIDEVISLCEKVANG